MVPATDIAAGSLLHNGLFHDPGFVVVEPGDMTVAIVVDPAHIPAGLEPGDTAYLVGVPPAAPGDTQNRTPGSTVVEHEALIVAVATPEVGQKATVTVAVSRDVAADITWLAADGRIALAEVR